ncbi:hypothetical protein BAU15_08225 [Enterococcus sp. JM4C]|uniref:DUF1801 domain-containing protein n=1 Tax=Candidatus Enterococcus huntleyi TaxID=1857217 RepID=UPI0013795D6C|nr:DUF1801 domain-containing protein [Enterococcus sp. JM4C]KAF1297881.1 hypothetical protein BAU15_08225 [Enterococcus sp. JM4C]
METIEEYEAQLPEKWRASYFLMKETLIKHLPDGFKLVLQYGFPTFVVPLSVYPNGYLGRTDEPLPFVSLAAQKNHLAVYHMGIMGNRPLLAWFEESYKQQMPTKLNMGKSCIRFTNPKTIPYALIGELMEKMTPEDWITAYEHYQDKK